MEPARPRGCLTPACAQGSGQGWGSERRRASQAMVSSVAANAAAFQGAAVREEAGVQNTPRQARASEGGADSACAGSVDCAADALALLASSSATPRASATRAPVPRVATRETQPLRRAVQRSRDARSRSMGSKYPACAAAPARNAARRCQGRPTPRIFRLRRRSLDRGGAAAGCRLARCCTALNSTFFGGPGRWLDRRSSDPGDTRQRVSPRDSAPRSHTRRGDFDRGTRSGGGP